MNNYQKITEYLNQCIKNDALSHAYIFYGPDEIMKSRTAFWFANKILKNENGKWHLDLLLIKPESDGEIAIGLIRQIKKFLVLSTHTAEYKIALIESAEKLNDYSQNALLKIFEEAPAHAIIILCVKTLDSLLPTIVSRGIKLPFWRQNETAVGSEESRINGIFNRFMESDFNGRYLLAETLSKNKPAEIFSLWLAFLRNKLLAEPSVKTAEILKTGQQIYFKLNETNFNPKLAYDELILSLE